MRFTPPAASVRRTLSTEGAMANPKSIMIESKPRKRAISSRQKASSLFQLWHGLQDVKVQAEQLKDKELVLLVGMVELLIEERTAGLGKMHRLPLTAAEVRPN
jgi:hypothetical protein